MDIGEIIKKLRAEAGMTQAQLGEKSGLSFTTISKLEKGSLTGTIPTHRKLAQAFNLSLSQFYKGLDEPEKELLKVTSTSRPQADIFYYNDKAISQILLKKAGRHNMLPELVRLEPNGQTALEQKPRGVEQFIYVLEGKIELKAGSDTFRLKKGECIYIDAFLPHTMKNDSSAAAKILKVTSPATL